MTERALAVVLWTAALAVGAAGLAGLPGARRDRAVELHGTDVPVAPPAATVATGPLAPTQRLALFRASRTMPASRFSATETEAAGLPGPERPPWYLSGVLIAEPPLAVFEEQPGSQNGAYVVTVGDRIDHYLIVAVAEDSAVVESGPSRWTFRVDRPW